jgi:hypothetical protein
MESRSVVVRVFGVLGAAVLFLVAWMVYVNVMSNDATVLEQAEVVARKKVGCADCIRSKVEGTSRVIDKKYAFTFSTAGSVTVVCRRKYIAFGDFACAAQ